MGGGGEGEQQEDVKDGEEVNVNIRCSNGSKFSVQVDLNSTVDSFKSLLAQNCDIPPHQQRLIYKGRILKDHLTLRSYGLEDDHAVHLVRGFPPAASATGGSDGASNNVPPVNPNDVGELGGSGLGGSLFPGLGLGGLGGTGGLFGAGFPEFEQLQQHLTRNPNIMRDIANMPFFQDLANNPEIIRNFIMNNPQMRDIMDRNPELVQVFNDPSIFRQTLEAVRNPELMREMMRNTDRAMSNIEASPEGFNALRRMYETVQEPFLNATTAGGNADPFAALLGNQAGNQTRDGSTNISTTNSETAAGSPAPNTNPLPNPWTSADGDGAQSNTTRSTPGMDARSHAPSGLGGLGLPNLDSMFGAMPNATFVTQLMQNPALSQMMQTVLSNPHYMNQMLGMNPQLRSMLDSNPQLREMMQNPDFIRQVTSPETLQLLLSVQQSLMPQLGRQQSTLDPGQTGAGTGGGTNMSMETLMNLFGGLGAGSLAVPNRPNVPPEELYATQLTQLQEMGFFDTQENIRALTASAGNVHAAVERLLDNPGQ